MKIISSNHFLRTASQTYYWASDHDLAPGTVITAGDFVRDKANPFWHAQERRFEKVRSEKYPHRPSRLGALYISPDRSRGMKWKNGLNRGNLYAIQIISGEPYRTDSFGWGDSMVRIRDIYHGHSSNGDEVAKGLDAGTHPATGYVDAHANSYWNHDQKKENEWAAPEIILPKGSQIKILERVS